MNVSISSVFSMLFPVIGVIETTDVSPRQLTTPYTVNITHANYFSGTIVHKIKSVSMTALLCLTPTWKMFPMPPWKKIYI